MSRAELAARLDLSERHVYRLERGVSPLKRMHLLAFAEALDVPLETIEETVAA